MTSFRSFALISLIVCLLCCSISADFAARLLFPPSHHSKWAATLIANAEDPHTSPVDVSVKFRFNSGLSISSTQKGYAAAFDLNLTATSNDPFVAETSQKWENNSFVWDKIAFPHLNTSQSILLVSPVEAVGVNATHVTGTTDVTLVDGNNTSHYRSNLLDNEFDPDWVANFTADPVAHNKTAEWVKLKFDVIADSDVGEVAVGVFGLTEHTHFFVQNQTNTVCKYSTGNKNDTAVDVAVGLHPSLMFFVMQFPDNFVSRSGPATIDCENAVGISISKKGPQPSLITMNIANGSALSPTMTVIHDTANKSNKLSLIALVAIGVGVIIAIIIAAVVVKKVCGQKKDNRSDAYHPLINN